MNPKDNLIKAIRLEKPERLPVTILSGGVWTFNNRGYTLKELEGKSALIAELIAETNEKVKSDVVWVGSGYNNLPVRAIGGKIKFRPKGAPDIEEPAISHPREIDQINLDRLAEDEGISGIWETAALLNQLVGDRVLVGAGGWGPFSLAAQIYGVEKMMHGLYKDQAAVHAILEFATEVSFRYYEGAIKAGAQIVSIGEPTSSGDMISRKHYEEFALPYQQKFIRRAQEAGAYTLLHICGDITNRLDLAKRTGADVLSVDYKVDLADVRAEAKGELAFAGNVNPVDILEVGTPEQVAAAVEDCLERAGTEGNFILMPGCDIPPGVPLENLEAFINTGLKYRY